VAKEKNEKRRKRLVFYAALAAFSFLIYILPNLYEKIDPSKLLPLIEEHLSRVTGQSVHIRKISIGFSGGLELRAEKIIVVDLEGSLIAKIDEMRLVVEVKEILRKEVCVKEATIIGGTARIHKNTFEERKTRNGKTKGGLNRIISMLTAESIIIEDIRISVCKDEEHTEIDGCFNVLVKRLDATIKDGAINLSTANEVTLPWYTKSMRIGGNADLRLTPWGLSANANFTATVPDLEVRPKWKKEKSELLATEGEIELKLSGFWKEKKASIEIEGQSKKLILKSKGKEALAENLEMATKISYENRTIKVESGKILMGNPQERLHLTFSGKAELAEKEKASTGSGFDISKLVARMSIILPDMKIISKCGKDFVKQWPLEGKLQADASFYAEGRVATGEIKLTGKDVKINLPNLYGKTPPRIEEISLAGGYRLSTNEVGLDKVLVKLGSSVVNISGNMSFVRPPEEGAVEEKTDKKAKDIKINAIITAPELHYKDVKPLLPRKKMKVGARRFFFENLKSAGLKNTMGSVKINGGAEWKKAKKLVKEGLQAFSTIESVKLDFGSGPVTIKNGKVSLYHGDLSFFDINARYGGQTPIRLRLDIDSLSRKARMVLSIKDKMRAESLMKFLRAPRIRLGKTLRGVSLKGWLYPSLKIELPLQKKGKPLMSGSVRLKNAKMSVAGAVPLMEDIVGRVEFGGRTIKSPGLDFRVGKNTANAVFVVPNYNIPKANIAVFCSNLEVAEVFNAVPPRERGDESEKREDIEVRIKIKAQRGRYDTLRFNNLDMLMVVRNDRVGFESFKMNFAGGRFRTDTPARILFEGVESKFAFFARSMDPRKVLRIFGVKTEAISGKMHAEGVIKTRGATKRKIIGNLNGKMKFKIKDGKIEDSNILSTSFNIINFDFSNWKARKLGYRDIEGTLDIKNGVIKSENLVINGFFMYLVATGWVDLAKRNMEIDIGLIPLGAIQKIIGKTPILGFFFRSKTGKKILAHYFRIKGPLNNYRVVQLGPEGAMEKLKDLMDTITGKKIRESRKENNER